ncbi:MAG: Asp-tRNA(Asn)/Glu-tRNA(Gln) amidotransferase GatCAB subunit A, partial [Flavobacteriia bacterium]|nr:Asp-tRNA(Asn)/Glu-tRNA(Gln) amidotransferase GatCAB subunit A [Flavobacteriia bacterium]
DGIHIGHRSEQFEDLESLYKLSRSEGFGKEVQRRILLGTFVLSAGYFDAFYGKAQKARRVVRDATLTALQEVDALIGPTTPHTAFPLGQEYTDPTVLYLEDIFTVQAPIAGIPAVNIPAGPHPNGLPFGMQIMAGPFDEPKLFQAARVLDQLS